MHMHRGAQTLPGDDDDDDDGRQEMHRRSQPKKGKEKEILALVSGSSVQRKVAEEELDLRSDPRSLCV